MITAAKSEAHKRANNNSNVKSVKKVNDNSNTKSTKDGNKEKVMKHD